MPGNLRWQAWGGYADKSECGRFSVSVATIHDGTKRFTLWILPKEAHSTHRTCRAAKAEAEKIAMEITE